jgi:glycosyltransferase involved in cell wall biosynthesis
MSAPLRVMWVGLRGFPNVQGGVETHAEQLCPMLHEFGCDVTVVTRNGYQLDSTGEHWKGVRFVPMWAPRHKHLEAVVHTFLAVTYAGLIHHPDVLHIQAIGPGLWTLWARILGMRVVVTHHGPDYERQKWGRVARMVLRLGEACSAKWASQLIVISNAIHDAVAIKHGRLSEVILNGIIEPSLDVPTSPLQRFDLTPYKYVALVSRLVPEKRHLDLIEAFRRAQLPDWKLVIVGGADHADGYARSVIEAAAKTPGVVCTGLQTGHDLHSLYAHAGLFVLPSSHEGLPISVLEALSFGVPVLASDIPANLEVGLPKDCYFHLGDIEALAHQLTLRSTDGEMPAERQARRQWACETFSWVRSAQATVAVYERACGHSVLAAAQGGELRAHEPTLH